MSALVIFIVICGFLSGSFFWCGSFLQACEDEGKQVQGENYEAIDYNGWGPPDASSRNAGDDGRNASGKVGDDINGCGQAGSLIRRCAVHNTAERAGKGRAETDSSEYSAEEEEVGVWSRGTVDYGSQS